MQGLVILLFVVLLSVLAARGWTLLIKVVRGGKRNASITVPPYTVRQSILTPEERAYLEVLQQVMGDHAIIFPKVSLAQVLEFPGSRRDYRRHWSRVLRRSADLLVCDREFMPVLAVKFDANAGRRRKQSEDPLVDSLSYADLPLMSVKPAQSYKTEDVTIQVKMALARHDSELSEDGSITREHDIDDEEFEDSRFPRFRRWTSELWAPSRRT